MTETRNFASWQDVLQHLGDSATASYATEVVSWWHTNRERELVMNNGSFNDTWSYDSLEGISVTTR